MSLDEIFKKRCYQQYRDMSKRCLPKLWKNGKKKDSVRIPGLKTLPFWRDELWDHVTAQVPAGGADCPYCAAIGRRTIIFLDTFVLDHHEPLKWVETGADPAWIWRLANLVCVCPDCNNIKGSMSYPAFIVIMRDFIPDFDPRDQKYLTACLRTHGQVMRGFGKKDKPTLELPQLAAPPLQRTLDDDF